MKLKSHTKEPDVMVEMNMTPLIDVMLVLLIMLIITIPIQYHATHLSLSEERSAGQSEVVQPIKVLIKSDGAIFWNGEPILGQAALENAFKKTLTLAQQPNIWVLPSETVAYSVVAGVMATAQRLGVTQMSLLDQEV